MKVNGDKNFEAPESTWKHSTLCFSIIDELYPSVYYQCISAGLCNMLFAHNIMIAYGIFPAQPKINK